MFFLLVEDVQLEMARVSGLAEAFERHGIELIRFPVVDEAIPADRSAYRVALQALTERLSQGRNVVVACRGGLGRTGTAVACLLVEGGLDPEAAIRLTQSTRKHTITNREQQEFVRGWSEP